MNLSKERLMVMLQMQDDMNKKVNPNWLSAHYPWLRAVVVEGAEAMEHYGWKWWKKQEPDMNQFDIELVDIWHFLLSHYVQRCEGHLPSACGTILGMLSTKSFETGLWYNGVFHRYADMSTLDAVELLIAMAASNHTNVALFQHIIKSGGMTWDTLYTGYVSKNVLNFFRQDHGYKEGTYQKIWNGEEDNVVLAQIMEHTDDPVLIYRALEARYEGCH